MPDEFESGRRADSKTNVRAELAKASTIGFCCCHMRAAIGGSCSRVQEACQIFACDKKALSFFFTGRLQCHKTPTKTVMLKYSRHFLTSLSVAIYTVALFLCSCATFTEPSSQVTVQQLKNAHLAFITNHTCAEGTRATWDQASFDKEVADITKQFTDAEAAVSKTVPARKEFIRNSANLFRRDAALVQKQHCLSPSFAANKKKQLQQNYDLLLQQIST